MVTRRQNQLTKYPSCIGEKMNPIFFFLHKEDDADDKSLFF